jgi:hypothetical protein
MWRRAFQLADAIRNACRHAELEDLCGRQYLILSAREMSANLSGCCPGLIVSSGREPIATA